MSRVPATAASPGIPILGVLGPFARIAFLATLAATTLAVSMDLVFHLEGAAVGAAVGISALVAMDGESNWLEGALLMLVYLILAISFFELRLPV